MSPRYWQQAQDLLVGLALLAILAALLWALLRPTPTVQFSWPDRQCVQVTPATAGNCTNLPDRYRKVWVAPQSK